MESFLEQVLIFIGSSLLFVPLFLRLGFGSVLGYLVAGICIGPDVLNLIKNQNDQILHFAELGVSLLLFVIGLEMQPRKLWDLRTKLLGLGFFGTLSCTVVFAFILSFMFGLSPLLSSILGFSLSLSSTALVVQTLTERNELKSKYGESAFSVLLSQDLLAIPALAILPALVASSVSDGPSVNTLISFGAVVLALFLLGKFMIRPLFRVVAVTKAREIFTELSLFIVLLVAVIMMKIGLSAALGTFLSGVLLADSEYRHELEANIDPFKDLLMGLFFLAVGMGVNVGIIFQNPLTILSLTAGFILVKFILIYFAARLFRHNHENSFLLSLHIAQGGEFAFVIFSILSRLHEDTPKILETLISVITLSMLFSPVILLIHDRLRKKLSPETKNYDQFPEGEPKIIIAGFGRVGQVFGRLLRSQNIPFVAIDHDLTQVELVRKFGNKVYYGDVSRLDILSSAGGHKAKYLVVAIDDVNTSLSTVDMVKKHFPNLIIFARARNRGHAFDLLERGVKHIKRETFDSSVNFAGELFSEMGMEKDRINVLIERFRIHDEKMLLEQMRVRKDDKMFISVSQQGAEQLSQVLDEEKTKTYI